MLVDRLLTGYEQRVNDLSLRWANQTSQYRKAQTGLAESLYYPRKGLVVGLLCGGVGTVALFRYLSRRADFSVWRYMGHVLLKEIDRSF